MSKIFLKNGFLQYCRILKTNDHEINPVFRGIDIDFHVFSFAIKQDIPIKKAEDIAIAAVQSFVSDAISYDTLRTKLSGMGAGINPTMTEDKNKQQARPTGTPNLRLIR